jgi:hypothetical protein
MSNTLTEKKCLPCEGGVPPLSRADCEKSCSASGRSKISIER